MRRKDSGTRALPTLPIAQSTIGKVPRPRFRIGMRNDSPSPAPESLSHSYVNSSMVADASSVDQRPAAPRSSFTASWLPPYAPCALDRLGAGSSASAPSPPHPHARSSGARIKSERGPR